MENLTFNELIGEDENSVKPIYFEIEALQKYFNNPRYHINFSDYRGTIVLKDEYINENNEFEEIKNFGIAYNKISRKKSAIVLFAGDIVSMSEKERAYWFSYCINNQNSFYPNADFITNLIYGEWTKNISIYNALLMEMHYINECCKVMNLSCFFMKEYKYESYDSENRPDNYHMLIIPTKHEYENFVLTLTKMITDNINIHTFTKCTFPFTPVEASKKDNMGNTIRKGSKTLLEEWLTHNTENKDTINEIIKPLKDLIEQRQIPGHQITNNTIDKSNWDAQDQLINSVYRSIRSLRLLFKNHPTTKSVEICDTLLKGEHIITY